MLVRIKPANARDQHVLIVPIGGQPMSFPIRKEKGWVDVPDAVAHVAAAERMNDANPDSPLVFDVMSAADARTKVEAETRREDPAGTPDNPARVQPQPLGVPEPPPRLRGRSAPRA